MKRYILLSHPFLIVQAQGLFILGAIFYTFNLICQAANKGESSYLQTLDLKYLILAIEMTNKRNSIAAILNQPQSQALLYTCWIPLH